MPAVPFQRGLLFGFHVVPSAHATRTTQFFRGTLDNLFMLVMTINWRSRLSRILFLPRDKSHSFSSRAVSARRTGVHNVYGATGVAPQMSEPRPHLAWLSSRSRRKATPAFECHRQTTSPTVAHSEALPAGLSLAICSSLPKPPTAAYTAQLTTRP